MSAQQPMNLKAALGDWMLRRSGRPMFITRGNGHVVEMNSTAEKVLADDPALAVRMGRLVAIDDAENQQLSSLITKAIEAQPASAPARLLLGRSDHRPRQIVTIFPLASAQPEDEQPLAMIFVDTLLEDVSPNADLSRLFGLSPAEERLAKGLLRGRTLQELTQDFGLQMPTLRAQLRSILRKCGVRRQIDLLQVLRAVR